MKTDEKQVGNLVDEAFFRGRGDGESKDAYMRAWMAEIQKRHHEFREIGQPRIGERISWRQSQNRAWELRPGMMISDELPNQTWRRIIRVHLKGTASDMGKQKSDVIVQLCEFPVMICFDDYEAVQALRPDSVPTANPRMKRV